VSATCDVCGELGSESGPGVGAWERRGSYDYSAIECQRIKYLVVAHLLLMQGIIRDASHVGEVELGSRVMCGRGSTQQR
jgi:hypothetical protein